jgi:hypothetical protein
VSQQLGRAPATHSNERDHAGVQGEGGKMTEVAFARQGQRWSESGRITRLDSRTRFAHAQRTTRSFLVQPTW